VAVPIDSKSDRTSLHRSSLPDAKAMEGLVVPCRPGAIPPTAEDGRTPREIGRSQPRVVRILIGSVPKGLGRPSFVYE
jgi:hypothetical protein